MNHTFVLQAWLNSQINKQWGKHTHTHVGQRRYFLGLFLGLGSCRGVFVLKYRISPSALEQSEMSTQIPRLPLENEDENIVLARLSALR